MKIRQTLRQFVAALHRDFVNKLVDGYLVVELWVCAWWCRRNYARVLRCLKQKSPVEKIRVLFVVSEPAKWKCQTLYEELNQTGLFEATVALSAWNCQGDLSDDQLDAHLTAAKSFFERIGDRCVVTVKTHPRSFVDLRKYNPDIVVYNEQWRPCFEQHPVVVSRFALTCFIPYYIPIFGVIFGNCQQPVEQLSFAYFMLNQDWKDFFSPYFNKRLTTTKLLALGHPALDFFSRQVGRKPKKDYVIFAPHFAIPINGKKGDWQTTHSTFDWSGRELLAYAKLHPEISWVFKPHPLLRTKLVEVGFMTKEELDDYYAEWENIGVTCYSGDYQELFFESRAMLTDSASFLAEYAATGRPLIHLWCDYNDERPPAPSVKLMNSFYRVSTKDELRQALKLVVEDRQDPKREERLRVVKELGLCDNDAAKNMVAYFKDLLRR